MAIVTKKSKEYYKLDYEQSYIMGKKVYPRCVVYKDKENRDKEKERESKISEFLAFCAATINKICSQADKTVAESEKWSQIPPEELDQHLDEFLEDYPELKDSYNRMLAYDRITRIIDRRAADFEAYMDQSWIFEQDEDYSIIEPYLDEMKEKGFDEAWIKDPVVKERDFSVMTQEYQVDAYDHAMFYNNLKTVMDADDIEDC